MLKPYHYDEGKVPISLLQWAALIEVAKVARFGATKYGQRNWEENAPRWSYGQLADSAYRHLIAWQLGEDKNPESKCHHLAHAAWNILSLLELTERGLGKDDRSAFKTDVQKILYEEPSVVHSVVEAETTQLLT